MGGRHEFFGHTADTGIEARGATLAEALEALARGLTELLVEDSPVRAVETRRLTVEAEDAPALARKWLHELLCWFSAERFLPARYTFEEASPTRLTARVEGERFDPARHQQGREVKAITRHQLEARETPEGWVARVIVDI